VRLLFACMTLTALSTSWVFAQQAPNTEVPKQEITIDLSNSARMTFVRIEPGEFLMGSPENDRQSPPDERPQRRVKITRAFFLGRYEVTRGQFRVFADETNYKTAWEVERLYRNWRKPDFPQTDEHPVVMMAWSDAKAFCDWLEKHPKAKATGVTEVRLPTEAEWEYSCRAGTTTRYFSGDREDDLKGFANVADKSWKRNHRFAYAQLNWDDGFAFTAPVGKFKPNRFGLYDMHGNAAEWCEDYHGPYADLGTTDPVRLVAPRGHEYRVCRGGSFDSSVGVCASGHRTDQAVGHDIGFRVLVPRDMRGFAPIMGEF
jgi:formylglycine-generating enzyme required for sulfatase activity